MSGVSDTQGQLSSLLGTGVRRAARSVQAAAFWAAILFPMAYVAVFLTAALFPDHAVLQTPVLAALLASNALTLVAGHRYRNER